jgi:hypothetical protein
MIYSTTFSNNFVSSVQNNLTNNDSVQGLSTFAIIYSGAQPTPADFIANWSTTYYIAANTNVKTSAANVLVSYGGMSEFFEGAYTQGANIISMGQSDIVLSVNSNSIYLAQAGTAVYWHDGTAAWAAIFKNTNPPSANGSSYDDGGLQQASISSSTNFMLCPVSDNAGNGIVQLSNVTVSGSAPTLDAVDIIITL